MFPSGRWQQCHQQESLTTVSACKRVASGDGWAVNAQATRIVLRTKIPQFTHQISQIQVLRVLRKKISDEALQCLDVLFLPETYMAALKEIRLVVHGVYDWVVWEVSTPGGDPQLLSWRDTNKQVTIQSLNQPHMQIRLLASCFVW